jgi:hypothetical protein
MPVTRRAKQRRDVTLGAFFKKRTEEERAPFMSEWRRTRLEDVTNDGDVQPKPPSGGDAVDALRTSAFCAICSDTSIAPIITICAHTFCTVCWNRWVDTCRAKGQRVQCPTCKKSTRHMQHVTPNRPLRQMLEQLVQWQCPACPEKSTTKEEAEKHQKECPNRIVKCTGCGIEGKKKIMRVTHPLVCSVWPTRCPNAPACNLIVPRGQLDDHLEVCPHEIDNDDIHMNLFDDYDEAISDDDDDDSSTENNDSSDDSEGIDSPLRRLLEMANR